MAVAPDTLLTQGYEARKEHRPDDAKRFFAEAIDLSRQEDDQDTLARALAGLGQIERDLGNRNRALEFCEESVAVCRTLNDPQLLAHTVRHLADILRGLGDSSLAETHYKEALQIYREHSETKPLDLANTLRGYALLKTERLATRDAQTLWQEAKDLYASLDVEAGVKESERQLSLLA